MKKIYLFLLALVALMPFGMSAQVPTECAAHVGYAWASDVALTQTASGVFSGTVHQDMTYAVPVYFKTNVGDYMPATNAPTPGTYALTAFDGVLDNCTKLTPIVDGSACDWLITVDFNSNEVTFADPAGAAGLKVQVCINWDAEPVDFTDAGNGIYVLNEYEFAKQNASTERCRVYFTVGGKNYYFTGTSTASFLSETATKTLVQNDYNACHIKAGVWSLSLDTNAEPYVLTLTKAAEPVVKIEPEKVELKNGSDLVALTANGDNTFSISDYVLADEAFLSFILDDETTAPYAATACDYDHPLAADGTFALQTSRYATMKVMPGTWSFTLNFDTMELTAEKAPEFESVVVNANTKQEFALTQSADDPAVWTGVCDYEADYMTWIVTNLGRYGTHDMIFETVTLPFSATLEKFGDGAYDQFSHCIMMPAGKCEVTFNTTTLEFTATAVAPETPKLYVMLSNELEPSAVERAMNDEYFMEGYKFTVPAGVESFWMSPAEGAEFSTEALWAEVAKAELTDDGSGRFGGMFALETKDAPVVLPWNTCEWTIFVVDMGDAAEEGESRWMMMAVAAEGPVETPVLHVMAGDLDGNVELAKNAEYNINCYTFTVPAGVASFTMAVGEQALSYDLTKADMSESDGKWGCSVELNSAEGNVTLPWSNCEWTIMVAEVEENTYAMMAFPAEGPAEEGFTYVAMKLFNPSALAQEFELQQVEGNIYSGIITFGSNAAFCITTNEGYYGTPKRITSPISSYDAAIVECGDSYMNNFFFMYAGTYRVTIDFDALTMNITTSSAIDAIYTEMAEGVEFYTLQGLRVVEPKAGNVYIRRAGATVTKIAL